MAQIETWFDQDLKKAVKVRYIDGNVFSADNNGNIIGVNVFDNGEPATLAGTVAASVIRADGATVAASGTLSGNQVSVTLPQAAYAVPGVLSVVIKLTNGSDVTTVCAVVCNVYKSTTDTVVDPGTIIPSIDSLIAEIEAAVASIPADYSSLWESLAPDYTNITFPVTAGKYCTYNGTLYIAKVDIATTESFNAAHWQSTNIGDNLSALKSAFDGEMYGTGGITDYFKETPFIINSSGSWSTSTGRHISIPVNSGDSISLTGNSQYAGTYAALKSDNAANGVAADFCANTQTETWQERKTLAKDTTATFAAPSDCNILYIAIHGNNDAIATPVSIKINNVEYTYNIRKKIDANTADLLKTFALATDKATTISNGTDADTLMSPGNYVIISYSSAQTISNIPEKNGARLIVLNTINAARVMQIFIVNSAYANIYVRFYDGTSWNAWHHIVYDFEQFRNSKNLLPKERKETSFYDCDVVYDNGCIDVNGTASASGGANNAITDGFTLKAGTYTMSLTYGSTKRMRVWLKDAEGNNLANVTDIYNPDTFNISSAKTGCRLGVQLVNESVYDHNIVYVQIEQSDYQTAFELPTFQTAIDAVCRNSNSNILSAFTNIECIGDSLTWGAVYTSDSAYRQSYKPYPVILGHITGATVTSVATPGFNPTEWWNEYHSQISSKTNALAIIFLGTNGGLTDTLDTDVSGDDPSLWANTHTGNYARIVNAYISSGYKVLLVKCFKTSGDIAVTNNVILQMADKFKCGIVENDYLPSIAYHDTPDRTYSNALHYNDFGYAAMAYQIVKNVEEMSETHKTYMIQA